MSINGYHSYGDTVLTYETSYLASHHLILNKQDLPTGL